jgi:hypothetical protein
MLWPSSPARGTKKASQIVPTVPRAASPISALSILLGLGALAHAAAARAEVPASQALGEVVWQAPAGCPDVSEIRSKIQALLGPARVAREPLAARAEVSRDASGFTARIELNAPGASESKTIQAPDCGTLGEAYALIVAFVLDPSAGQAHPAPARAGPQGPSSSHSSPTAPPTRRRARTSQRAFALGAAAVGALGVGQLPFPAFGVGARLNAGRFVYGELGALYWPARHESVSTPEGTAGADVSLITAESALCVPVAREALAACLGLSAGTMRAAATGVAHPSEGSSAWVSANAALTTLLPISGSFALRFRLALGVPVSRPSFVLDELGPEAQKRTAFRPEPLFGAFSLEPELRFFSTDSRRAGHGIR